MEWSCIIPVYLRMVEKFREKSENIEDCARSGQESAAKNFETVAMARDHWVHINQKIICQILHNDLGKKQLCAKFVLCDQLDEIILPR